MTSTSTRNPQRRRVLSGSLLAAMTIAVLAALSPAGASAEYGLQPGSAMVKSHAPAPTVIEGFTLPGGSLGAIFNTETLLQDIKNEPEEIQAGGHPDITTAFKIQDPAKTPEGETKDIITDAPAGTVGLPNAVPPCPAADLNLTLFGNCPPEAQIGFAVTRTEGFDIMSPVYSMVPIPREQGAFGFKVIGYTVNLFARVRSESDYGLTVEARDAPTASQLTGIILTFWGVPYDPAHDGQRFDTDGSHEGTPLGAKIKGTAVRPFTSAATNCGTGPQTATVSVRSWGNPGQLHSADSVASEQTGCDQVEFAPEVTAEPTTGVADSPAGFNVDIHVPQNTECDPGPPIDCGLSTSHLKDTVVSLPAGVALNPSAANGLVGCKPAEIGLTTPVGSSPIHFTGTPAKCPDASKIGTAEVETPLLEAPAPGALYLAEPFDNPFKSRYGIYIEVNDPTRGLVSKFAGHVVADPQTGQLTTTVVDQPQLPFEHIRLNFKQGPHAPLRTPPSCGTFTTASTLTPYSAPDSPVSFEDGFTIDSAPDGSCALQNGASLDAGTVSPLAGRYSPMVVRLSRPDGSQEFGSVTVTPPPGLTARLAGVPYCPDAALGAAGSKSGAEEQASPSCPSASDIGDVVVGAGAGPSPYYTGGQVYLTGPYKGAPLSLAVIVPVNAGPFDLGTVVVRVGLRVDPVTTQITAVSDEIPHILQGIPLDVRTVAIELNRSEFTKNPTSCDPTSVRGSLLSTLGNSIDLSTPFQLGECRRLGFKPKLSLRLTGKRFNRRSNPGLKAVLTPREGDANIASASVQMPRSIFLDQSHIDNVCTRVEFATHSCPAGSVYGHAVATTPLFDQPLQGPVYLRSSSHELPDLVADLQGQVPVELIGRTDAVKGALRNTFELVPDAPVSRFVLTLEKGKKSLLVASTNLCKKAQQATVTMVGHNGHKSVVEQPIGIPCKGKKSKRGAKRHARR